MTRLNHIGIAISHLPRLVQLFSILGLNVDHAEQVPDQGVVTHFVPLPQAGSSIELLEVLDPKSPVAKFLQKRGPGIHHLAFSVESKELLPLCERLKEAGFHLIYPTPKRGAHGTTVNFIHPSTAEGVLIELIEFLN
jgi:methylmalonyl-CoA epimerase